VVSFLLIFQQKTLNKIGQKIKRMYNNMKKTISVSTKLTTALSFSASGDSYKSFKFPFRASESAVSLMRLKICEVLTEQLKDYVILISI
jgi:hypothetical protein